MCKHNWIPMLPNSKEISLADPLAYAVEKFIARMIDVVYCTKCCKSGHHIKSCRGGVRVHYYSDGYFVNKANEVREKFGLEKLNSDKNHEECDATEAQ
jgi:hypothetical protein